MCQMQSRMAVVRIKDIPNVLAEDIDEKKYEITVNDLLIPNEPLVILLVLKGLTGYLTPRKPRSSEYEDESIPHIDIGDART